MSVDKDKLRALANEAQGQYLDWVDAGKPCPVWNSRLVDLQKQLDPEAVLAMLDEINGLHAQHARDSGELRKLCAARDSARRERDQLKAENEALRMQVKEIDLLFGRYLLGMRAAVVEWQKGKGADAAMQWIWNGLRGPGELPPDEETQAQAYFDREVVKIEEGLEEVYAYRDKRRSEKAKEQSK